MNQEFVFVEMAPKRRLIKGKEARKLEALVKSLLKNRKTQRCPSCGSKLQHLKDKDFFCLNCEWDNLPKLC